MAQNRTLDESTYVSPQNLKQEVKPYMNVEELSEYIKIPKWTIYQWVSQRRVPCYKFGSLLRFRQDEIEAWAKRNFRAAKSYNEVSS